MPLGLLKPQAVYNGIKNSAVVFIKVALLNHGMASPSWGSVLINAFFNYFKWGMGLTIYLILVIVWICQLNKINRVPL